MLIRFVVFEMNENSNQQKGLFQAAYDLKYDEIFSEYELNWFDEIVGWFNVNLDAPRKLSRSSKPYAHYNAICWFKDSAHRYIAKMHELRTMIEYHGRHTKMITTNRPGYIVYEDEYQLASVPF